MSGYDKFFKEAGKASGLVTGKPAPKKSQTKQKFKLGGGTAGAKSQSRDRVTLGTPEDQLRREIALRARERKAVSMRKRQAFPRFPAIIALVAILSCTVGYFKPDLVDDMIGQVSKHVDIGVFGNAQAADSPEKPGEKSGEKSGAKKPDKKKEVKAVGADKVAKAARDESAKAATTGAPDAAKLTQAEGQPKSETPADIRSWSDEELSFFNKLNDRKKELDLREAELTKLDEELQKQKVELDHKIKQLESMRADISKTLKTRVAVDQEKVDKLVQTYSTMKPQNAAGIIQTLNEDLAVEVMDKMKKKNAAEIMNMMDPKKARRLSELLTGYQRTPASASADAANAANAADKADKEEAQ